MYITVHAYPVKSDLHTYIHTHTYMHTYRLEDAKQHCSPHMVIMLCGNKSDLEARRAVSYQGAIVCCVCVIFVCMYVCIYIYIYIYTHLERE
jgi:hypothetical protein